MEESKGLSASFQQQPPLASQGQPFSFSTASYFGNNTFGGDDPFQFAKPPPTTQYTNSQIGADVNSQVGNFIPPQSGLPPVTTNQEPISISTFSPVKDKQFFSNAAMPPTNMVPPISTVDPKASSQQDETPLSLSSDINAASTNNIPSSDTGLTEQVPATSVPISKDNKDLPGGEFSVLPASGNEQSTNVTEKPHLQHCSYSNPGSQPESFVHHSDVSSGPMSLPAYPTTVQQQYTTENISNAGGTITGTFTNADLPLSSMLQPGPVLQPMVHSLVQDNKELLPNSNVLTNADISAGFGGMPSHSSSAANLSSLCSTPVDVRTNAAFFESDQQPSGALPTTSTSNLGPPTNADYTDVSNEQLQFRPPSNAGMTDQAVVMATNVFQPSETGLVLQTNTEFGNRMMELPSNINFSVGPPSQIDADKSSSNTINTIPPQVTSVSTNVSTNNIVMTSQTVSNVNVLSTTLATMAVSSSIPLTQSSTVKHQDDAYNIQGETKTASTAVVYGAQYGDTVEQQFLTSPVTQSPTSAFVEYLGSSSEKRDNHDNPLQMSSGKQSVSSLLDCPDTSILASPYKIVLPSPKTVEEKQISIPPQTVMMPEDAKVSSSTQMTAVTTSAPVHVAATPKTDPVRSTLPVTQATMTSTPKQKDTHDTLPSAAPPLVHQQEPQQRYGGNNEQRDFKDTSSLPPPPPLSTRQQEHEQSYHPHQYHHADHQSQYDYDYRHSRVPAGGGHYMEDDRGYYPPSRPHSRIPYDYYHPHPHDDYYYYRGRSEYYRDYVDDPYYYEDRYYQDRDPYHGREQLRYRDYEQPRYRDTRHPVGYDSYSEYPRGREDHVDRRTREPESYRYHQQHYYHGEKYYRGETSHYPERKEIVDRTDQSYVKQSHNQPLETTVAPPEASTIYGPRDHFEASHFYNEETLHAQPSYVDSEYSGQYTGQYPEQYPDQYPEQYPSQYHDQYPDQYHMGQDQYGDQVDTVYANEETYYEQQSVEQESLVHPVEPVVPARDTPMMFAHPHVLARFSGSGKLVTVVPSLCSRSVEISSVKVITQELQSFRLSVESFPGPLIVGDTTKGEVVRYASRQAELCGASTSDEAEHSSSTDPDEVLLWKLLVLLCQQNGVVVPSDITDLLLHEDSSLPSSTSVGQSATSDLTSSIDGYRKLLLEGRRKDALEYACSRSLWGHALMLASGMEEQCRTYVVNRFTASMMTNDPLNTYYTLMLGRTPSAVKPEGLARAGNWRSHLAMMMSNQSLLASPDHVNNSIVTLGDSLLSRSRLSAAHVCYHVGGAHLTQWDDSQCKFSLLGVNHRQQSVTSSPEPSILWKTEIYEYAIGLGKHDDILVHFQTLKLLHAFRLIEAGITDKALRYCESVAKQVSKKPDLFSASLIHILTELSIRLHHWNSPAGLVENEVSSWIAQLQVIASNPRIGQTYTSRPPSNRSSQVSPTFSSASGHQQQPYQQFMLGFSSNHSSSNFLHPNQALNIPPQTANVPSSATEAVSNAVQDNTVDETDNPHLTITQEQVSQYSQYMSTAPEQHQFAGVPTQDQHQFSGLVSSSIGNQYANEMVPLYGNQPSMVHNTAGSTQELLSHGVPPWPIPGDTVTQMSTTNTAQSSDQLPQLNTTANITGYISSGPPTAYSTGSEQNSHQMATEGFNTQYTGASSQQPMTSMLPNQSSLYSNFGSQVPSSEPTSVQADIHNLMPNVTHQSFSVAQPVFNTGRSDTGISQPITSAVASTSQSQTQQPGQKNEPPSSNEDTGQKEETKDTKDEKKTDSNKEKSGNGGGGWGFGNLIASILPKRKGEIHLPKDHKKKIVWDEKLKKWVNLDADDEEDSGPAAPPSDTELKGSGSAPASNSGSQPMRTITTDDTSNPSNNPTTDKNLYSRRLNVKRSNAREYVNILNPTGSSSSNAPISLPPMGPPLAANNAATFSGNFFVPKTPTVSAEGTAQERTAEDFFAAQPQQEDLQGGQSTEENMAALKQQPQPFVQHQHQQHEQQPNVVDQQFNSNPNENLWAQQNPSQQLLQQQQQQQQQQQLQPQQLQLQQQQQQLQQQIANAGHVSASGGQQTMAPTAVSATQQTSYMFTASTNTQSNVPSSTTDSFGQPQFFNPSMFSSNTAGISSGVQFTVGGSSGEQSLSRASSTSELSEEVNRHLSSGVLQSVPPPPAAAASNQPQPRSQVRRALGRHRLPQPRPHPQQQGQGGRQQGQQQQWWQPTAPGHVTDYKQ